MTRIITISINDEAFKIIMNLKKKSGKAFKTSTYISRLIVAESKKI